MSPHSRFFVRCAFATLAFAAAEPVHGGSQANTLLSAWDQGALERARKGAVERLREAKCVALLAEFRDARGEALERNLEPFGLDASSYMQTVAFKDGSRIGDCRRNSVYLATSPGLPSVFVCPSGGSTPGSRFAQVQARKPELAEYMVIHEMLHTLGLGENPPTSQEITERVAARCE